MRSEEDIRLMLITRDTFLLTLYQERQDLVVMAKVEGQIEALNWVLEQETTETQKRNR